MSVKYGVKLDTDKIEVIYNSGSNHSFHFQSLEIRNRFFETPITTRPILNLPSSICYN